MGAIKRHIKDLWYGPVRNRKLSNELSADLQSMEKEIKRLHDLLWVGVLCGACGHSYKYNRADDPDGEAGHEEHLRDYPDCPSQ